LRLGWFMLDFVSVLPGYMDIFTVGVGVDAQHDDMGKVKSARGIKLARVSRVLRLFRLMKMVRILRVSRILSRWVTMVCI
jgi:hypothetical protein